VMTKKCPTCGGDGIVVSETSAAVDVERRLRALAAGSRSQAYRVEVASKVASLLIGPGASRLVELEKQTRRRFYLVGKDDTHLDHFVVLEEGKREDLAPAAPVAEGAKVQLTLGEVGLHDPSAGVGKVDGLDVCVAGAAKMVGKKVNVQVERVLDGTAYATLIAKTAEVVDEPITAEGEAEKPTRRAPAKKAEIETEVEVEVEEPVAEEAEVETDGEEPKPKKKTRRGSRGGRGRKKPATAATNGASPVEVEAKIHVPDPELGQEAAAEEPPSEDGAEEPKPKKKTRRGTRGGRNRKKKPAAAASTAVAPTAPAANDESEGWEYVPMSQWGDDVPDGS
jgi:predicted RNA-binding protein with TRAM domain